MRTPITVLIFALVASGALAGFAGPGHARDAFRGANGKIAFWTENSPSSGVFWDEIWVINPDGSGLRRLSPAAAQTTPQAPVWSPDGRKLAYVDYPSVYVMNADGSGRRRVLRCRESVDCGYVTWLSSGRRLAIQRTLCCRHRVPDGIVLVNLDGTGVRTMARGGNMEKPEWSSGGRQIVFEHDGEVYVTGADRKGRRRLTTTSRGSSGGPRWSPDGSRILFLREGRFDDPHNGIWVIRGDGTNLTRLVRGRLLGSPSYGWSPDGRKIVYEFGYCRMFVLDLVTRHATRVSRPATGCAAGTASGVDWQPLP